MYRLFICEMFKTVQNWFFVVHLRITASDLIEYLETLTINSDFPKCLKILTIAAVFLENIWNFGLTINETIWKLYLEHMILLRKVVSRDNIYINESHWPYTLQIYIVCKFWVEISHRLMKIFFILKGWGTIWPTLWFFYKII